MSRSKLFTLAAIIAGIVAIYSALVADGDVSVFLSWESLLIVMGGSTAAVMINYNAAEVGQAISVVFRLYRSEIPGPHTVVEDMHQLAVKARKSGLLKLEDEIPGRDPFMGRALQFIVDGVDREVVTRMLRTEIEQTWERYKTSQAVFSSWGTFAPAFGMVGTLIGLINMLNNLNSPDTIGPAMAVALLTTLYGAMFANLILLPLAGKLEMMAGKDVLYKQMVLEGVLDIQGGLNPRLIEEKLLAFIRDKLFDQQSQNQEEPEAAEGGANV